MTDSTPPVVFTVDTHLTLRGREKILNALPFAQDTLDFTALCPAPAELRGHWPTRDSILADLFLSVYQDQPLDLTARTYLHRLLRKTTPEHTTPTNEEQALAHFTSQPGLQHLALERQARRDRHGAADEYDWNAHHWGVAWPARHGHRQRQAPDTLEVSFETVAAPPFGIFAALERLGLNVEAAYWGETAEFAGLIDQNPDGTPRHRHYTRRQLERAGYGDPVLNDVADRVSRALGFTTIRWVP